MSDREGTTRGAAEKKRPKPRPLRTSEQTEGKAAQSQRFADGGMVRGCKPGQMSGKGFSGTY
jgi:hypothetical protein